MTTLAIMLGLLVSPMSLVLLFERITRRKLLSRSTAGCLGITLVFLMTGIGHFVLTKPMSEMLPPWVPGRVSLVYLTGLIEFAAAAAILVVSMRPLVGWGLILMLVAFLPVNIYAALQHVELGGHESGPIYLLIRVPMQAILIGWIWWFAIRSTSHSSQPSHQTATS